MKISTGDKTFDLDDLDAAAILNSLPDGVYITDTDRRILFWNREAERMTGWNASDVIGHRCHENILCHVDKDGHLLCGREHCPLHRAMLTGTQSDLPSLIFAKRRDGQRIPVEVTVSPIRDNGGEVIGGIEVFRDLSPAFQDLNRARIIQRELVGVHIMPDPRIRIEVGYTPHDQVGGDFYRIEQLDENTYAILLADVVGHGVSAALYTMQLRALWEDGRAMLKRPREFLAWLSHRVEILKDTDAGYFATGLFAVYRADTGELTCGTAGHPPPLLVRRNGHMVAVESSGPGLGLLPDPIYEPATIVMEPGDRLLIYSDGALEIFNARGEELGESGLRDLVSRTGADGGDSVTAVTRLEEALLRYSENLALPDDLTLIHLVRVHGNDRSKSPRI